MGRRGSIRVKKRQQQQQQSRLDDDDGDNSSRTKGRRDSSRKLQQLLIPTKVSEYSSDETRSEVSLSTMERTPPNDLRDEDDSSTLSSSSSTSRQSKDSSTRSRGRGGRPRRRKRRQLSPVGSIKSSASLIALKIDEETDQDIIDEAGEDKMGDAYSLRRTKSAPEPRGRGISTSSGATSEAGRRNTTFERG